MPGTFVGTIELTDVGDIKIAGTDIQAVFVGGTQVFPTGGGGGWLPTDLGALLRFWHDAADTGTITDVGAGETSQIDDKGANGHDLVQGSSAQRPTTGTRTINALNVLDFDGDNVMQAAGVTVDPTHTGVLVLVNDAFAANEGFFALDAANDYEISGVTGDVPNFTPVMKSSNLNTFELTATANANGPSVYSWTWDSTSTDVFFYVDGTEVATRNNYNGNLSDPLTLFLFANRGGFQRPDGAFAEQFCFDGAGDVNRQTGEGYAAHKWGLESQLPPGHPFKSAPP